MAALVGLFARAAFGQAAFSEQRIEQDKSSDLRPLTTRLPAHAESKRYVAPTRLQPRTSPKNELKWRSHRLPVVPAGADEPTESPIAGKVRPAIQFVPVEPVVRPASEFRPRESASEPEALEILPDRGALFLVQPDSSDEIFPQAEAPRTPPELIEPSAPADTPAPPDFDPLPPVGEFDAPERAAPGARKEPPCDAVYRDSNCCTQLETCQEAWKRIQTDKVSGFHKDFLDITPLFKPDVSYQALSEIDQDKFRRKGLSLSAPRNWRTADGRLLLVADGKLFGLDGAAAPEVAVPLLAFVEHYNAQQGEVTLKSAKPEATYTAPMNKLSEDDQFWIKGRTWKDLHGRVIATGRLENYKWGRVFIRTGDGQIVQVPLARLGANELCYVDAYWGEGIGLPPECRLEGQPQIRNFTLLTFTWKASALCHKPLYFEEVQLERYGHSFGPLAQPVISGAHFFANIAILPYKMGIHPPTECVYALGYYRPGNCAPYMIPPVPFSIRGGLSEAGAVIGAAAILP